MNKKYFMNLVILIITIAVFTSCETQVYHTVTIDYDTEGTAKYTIIVKDGQLLYSPKDPEKNGYVFDGWKDENGEDFSFSTPIKGDITIKAKWVNGKTTLTIKDSSGSVIIKTAVQLGSLYSFPEHLGYAVTSCTDEEGRSLSITENSVRINENDMVIKIVTRGDYVEYSIGDIGPGGGYIVFDADKQDTSGMTTSISAYSSSTLGWRYLECSKEDLPDKYIFGYYRPSGANATLITENEGKGIGKGKTNTQSLIAAIGETAYTTENGENKADYAAHAASSYDGGDYCDWFLPSSEELSELSSVVNKNLGNVSNTGKYWSSTEYEGYGMKADSTQFNVGIAGFGDERSIEYLVRPFRCF